MEALVTIIAEFLFIPFLVVLLVLPELLFLFVELAILAIRHVPWFRNRNSGRPPSRWPRRIGIAILGLMLLLGVFLVLLETILFQPALRYGMARIREKTGIELSFGAATGSLLTGNIVLTDLELRRHDSLVSNFDLKSPKVALDVNMISILSPTTHIEKLEITHARGTFERVGPPPEGAPHRAFDIDRLSVEEADVLYRDRARGELAFKVERLESRPLHSTSAVFDILFRSNARGSIGGAPVAIVASGDSAARTTQWKGSGLPVRVLGNFIGGPFAWLEEGTADVDVSNAWSLDQESIHMRWKLVLHDVRAKAPEDATTLTRAIAMPVTTFINARSKELAFEFSLILDENKFKGTWSAEAAGLWNAAAGAAMEQLAHMADVPEDTVKEFSKSALDRIKKVLDERSKKRAAKKK